MTEQFSRIEALVDKEDINRVVLDATYILSSIKYNGYNYGKVK